MTPRPGAGRPDFIEAVFTCRGNFYDPNFPNELELLNRKLQTLLKAENDNLVIKKVEPWNSVKVTVNIPKEAAERLKALAQQNNGVALRNLGIMSLQMEGDRIISLTLKSATRAVGVSHDNAAGAANTQSSINAAGNAGIEQAASDPLPSNLLNPSAAPYNKLHSDKGAGIQPPVDRVPPLVLPKAKLEKRQRKPVSSKSRSSKSKSISSASATNASASGQSALPGGTSTSAHVTASSPSLAVMHPALKDTELSLSTDLTDQETVNGLLTTLFKRSLDPNNKSSSKSLTSSLPPHSAKKRRQLQQQGQLLATSTSSSSAFLSSTAVSSMTTSSFLSKPVVATPTDPHPKSEHVSVIARAQAPSNVQTEAMDLSGPGYARVSKPESPAVPMDLSAASSIQPTPAASTTSIVSLNYNNSLQIHEKLADPPDGEDSAFTTTETITSTQTSELDKSPSPLSATKAMSVIESTSAQFTSALDSTRQTAPTKSSQQLSAGSTSSSIADADSGCAQSSTSHDPGIRNGLDLNTKPSLEGHSSQVSVVHGRPVSVICSPMEDRSKSNSTSSEPARDEQETSLATPANIRTDSNSLMPTDSVIVRPPASETNGSKHVLGKDSICSHAEDITITFRAKYDGPSRQHLSALDQEPHENGSSTSTDSGVVAGSPKSDICATPPAVEEQHKTKSEPHDSRSAATTDVPPANVISNDLLVHPSLPTVPSSPSHIANSRHTVSILKTVRAHAPPRPTNDITTTALITPGVSVVQPSIPTQTAAQPHHNQTVNNINHQTTVHSGTSDVFLTASSTLSNITPIRVTLSTREKSASQPPFTTTQKVQTVVATPVVATDTQPRKVVLPSSADKLMANNELDDLRASNSRHRIVHELKGKIGVSPANASVADRQHGGNLLLSASLLKERIITPAINAKSQEIHGSVDSKVVVDPTSNITTVIVSPRTENSLPLTSADASNLHSTSTTPHHFTLSSVVKSNATQNNISPNKPAALNTCSDSGSTSNASVSSHNSHSSHHREDHHYSLRASQLVDTHSVLDDSVHRMDTVAHSKLDSSVAQPMVNGASECGESEGTDVIASSEPMSPESFTSGSVSLEVDVAGTDSSSLISPGQQRKSGRVRTLKSPDPDYITPTTKARKRSSRPTSESSNNSDVAGSTKKLSNLPISMVETLAEAPGDESSPAFQVNPPTQMNGPTSQAKRSTRSSGHSDLQALPTVYRERKRSKR